MLEMSEMNWGKMWGTQRIKISSTANQGTNTTAIEDIGMQ